MVPTDHRGSRACGLPQETGEDGISTWLWPPPPPITCLLLLATGSYINNQETIARRVPAMFSLGSRGSPALESVSSCRSPVGA